MKPARKPTIAAVVAVAVLAVADQEAVKAAPEVDTVAQVVVAVLAAAVVLAEAGVAELVAAVVVVLAAADVAARAAAAVVAIDIQNQ